MKKIILLFSIFIFISGCSGPALHGIGVYEGSYPSGSRHSFDHHPDSYIEVTIHAKSQPLIIVLSSYEPVVWKLLPDNGVKIKEIILSSYNPSKVVGIDSTIKVSRQPFGYSYKTTHSKSKLAVQVFKYTGLTEFESYQGSYKGEKFSIH